MTLSIKQNSQPNHPIADLHPLNSQFNNQTPEKMIKYKNEQTLEKIVRDKAFFLEKFYKIFAKTQKGDDYFQITITNNLFSIKGDDWTFFELKNQIELFRKLALEAFETRCPTHCILIDVFGSLFSRKASPESIDLANRCTFNQEDRISKKIFNHYVRPTLPALFHHFCIHYSSAQTTQLVDYDSKLESKNENATRIDIALSNSKYIVYPFPPHKIEDTNFPTDDHLYKLYKSKEVCDWTILSLEGTPIKVHALILRAYGGPYFQALLSSNMKETYDQCIQMHAPFKVIERIVESLYLGPKHLERAYKNGEAIDIYGILEFAHAHAMHPLFKQMVNLLILEADRSQAELIKDLAEIYEDDRLQKLGNYLSLTHSAIKA